jgi:hypothetical protein
MAGSSSAKTRFALLPRHDEEREVPKCFAEPVIGPRIRATPWLAMTETAAAAEAGPGLTDARSRAILADVDPFGCDQLRHP